VLVEFRRRDDAFAHGRCERYFDVRFHSDNVRAGEVARARITTVRPDQTWGVLA
jgi:hypothetical protein